MKKIIVIIIFIFSCKINNAQIINSVGVYAYNDFHYYNSKYILNTNYDILNFGLKSEIKISKRFSLVCNPMFNDFDSYKKSSYYNNCYYPFLLNETFQINNSRNIQINLGLKYNFLIRKKIKLYTYLCTDVLKFYQNKFSKMVQNNIVSVQENSFKHSNEYLEYLHFGLGCRYNIKPRISIDVEPLINTSFREDFATILPSFINYTSLGIGINYHFIKK